MDTKEQDVTKAQRTDAHNIDWYSLMLEDEIEGDATPKDIRPYQPTQDTTSHQQDEQNRKPLQTATPGAGQVTTPVESQPYTKPHPQDNQNQGQPRTLSHSERAKDSDTTEIIMEKLKHVKRIIQKHPQPEEQCAIPILLEFLLRKEAVKVKLTLLLTLCHNPGQRIPLDKLLRFTAAAWELTKNGDKPRVFTGTLGKLASKTDTKKKSHEEIRVPREKITTNKHETQRQNYPQRRQEAHSHRMGTNARTPRSIYASHQLRKTRPGRCHIPNHGHQHESTAVIEQNNVQGPRKRDQTTMGIWEIRTKNQTNHRANKPPTTSLHTRNRIHRHNTYPTKPRNKPRKSIARKDTRRT